VYFSWLNTERLPLNHPKLREALKLAVDRGALVKHVLGGGQIPTSDLVPVGLGGYKGINASTFDPAAAREAMHAAGYKRGADVPTITLTYNTSEGHKQIAEAVQQMWKKHLGISIEIENQEWKVFLKKLNSMDFQMARMGWIGDYADPYTFLELLRGQNGNNHSGWRSPEYEKLLDQANATLDSAARLGLLRGAETLAMQHTPLIPFYVYTRTELWKPYFMGHWPNYQNSHMFKYWWIDPRWYDGGIHEPLANEPPPLMLPDPAPKNRP